MVSLLETLIDAPDEKGLEAIAGASSPAVATIRRAADQALTVG
jgi:hypothetical protein